MYRAVAVGRGSLSQGMIGSHAAMQARPSDGRKGGIRCSEEQVGAGDALVEVERRGLLIALRGFGLDDPRRSCAPEVDLGWGTRRGSRGN
jgi:hypothetical protein